MKQKKNNDMVDRAEIIDDPTKRYEELTKISDELSNLLDIETNLKTFFNKIQTDLQQSTSHDPEIRKSDTVDCIKIYFDKIISELENTYIKLSSTVREKLYYVIYQISILFYEYIHKMRKFGYSLNGTKYLVWILTLLESNIVLSHIKYMKWRVKLYLELAFLYEDVKAYKSAFNVINQGITKLNELKSIEEQAKPLPDYMKDIFIEDFKYLKYAEFKYGILSGNLNFESWKKKLEETFNIQNKNNEDNYNNYINNDEILNRNICAMNSISNLSYYNSIVNHDGLKSDFKSNMVQYIYTTLLKPDIDNIIKGITEFIDQKKRDIELNNKVKQNEKNYEDILNEYLDKTNQNKIENYKNSCKNVPLEIHEEIYKACFDCKLFKEFIEINDSLSKRIKYRSIEMPYVSEIDIQMSSIQYANVPNKYEKIPLDLNINDYKKEIKRLREEGKYVNKEENEETENNKKDPKQKKPDPKKDNKKDPKAKKEKTEKELVKNPYEKIEGMEHNYVYLLLKKSHNPNKAIINVRIAMSNDIKIKKELKINERAIAIPIKTYKDNLYEPEQKLSINEIGPKYLPYLIVQKSSSNDLSDDNEKLKAVIDIKPLISNCPFTEPEMNYTKLEPEITIPGKNLDPNYINYNFNHNYINFMFKTDEYFYVIERECEILRNLYELENSFSENDENNNENNSKINNFLKLNYNFEKLDNLSTWMYNAIQGECGKLFLQKRSNFLYDICVLIYKKYLKEFLYRIEYFNSIQNELEENFKSQISTTIANLINNIFNTLYCTHYVLTNIKEKDTIIYSYISLLLANYAEITDNNATGVLILKDALEYIENIKEKENIFGLDNRENKSTFTSFTCDNNKINKLNNEINEKYDDYVKKLNKKRRVNYRKIIEKGIKKFEQDVCNEEDFEVNYLEDEYKKNIIDNQNQEDNKDLIKLYDGKNAYLKDKNNSDNLLVNYNITEYENNLNCLYIELTVKYYRMYIKSGDGIIEKINIYNNIDNNNKKTGLKKKTLPKLNLPDRIKNKLNIINGETATKVKNNMEYLKHSLQDAGKLSPDIPNLSKSEKIMKLKISKNSYLMSLFNATLAGMRPLNKQDQIYLLSQSNENINQTIKEEEERFNYYLNKFFYIKSMERFNKNTNQLSYFYYPYTILNKNIMIDNVEKIPEPILIHKTNKTASFIFPLIKIRRDQLDKIYHNINQIKIFGQISTGSNIVQLNNTTLQNTNKLISIFNYITIPNLKPNEKYIFAYAGYDTDNTIVNSIGETSKEVELYFPLPIHFISYQMCKIAFENKHYGICKERSKYVFNYFTERSDIKDINLDNKSNTIFFYKLKYDFIQKTSLFELEGIAFCFYYFSKSVIFLKESDHFVDNKIESNVYYKMKNILKNLNILSLGLEIAIYIRNYKLIKMFLIELYDISYQIINKKNLYKELINVYMKMNLGINIIPNELWDINLRRISSLIVYNIFLLSNMINESDLIKKNLIMEIGLMKKKYYPFKYTFLERITEEVQNKKTEKKEKSKKSTPKSPKKKEQNETESNNNTQEEKNEPKFKEINKSILIDIERECYEIDEFIFSCGDFNEIIKTKLDSYLTILDNLNMELNGKEGESQLTNKDKKNNKQIEEQSSNNDLYPELQIEIDKQKNNINNLIEVWDGFKNEGIKFVQKYVTSGQQKEKFYEYLSKIIKKSIENYIGNLYSTNVSSDKDKKNNIQNTNFADFLSLIESIKINQEDFDFIQNIFNQKISFITQDILYKMKIRIHDYLNTIKEEMPSDGTGIEIDLEKMGNEIEEKFFGCIVDNEILPPFDTLSQIDIINIKEKLFWIGDIIFNKGLILYIDLIQNNHNQLLNFDFNNFYNFRLCDLKKIQKYSEKKEDDDLKLLDVKLGYFNTKTIKVEPKKEEIVEEEDKNKKPAKKPDKKKAADKNKKDNKEEEIMKDPFDDIIDDNISERLVKLNKIFEQFALSSLCQNEVNNFSHFDNLLSFTYNIILYDMLSPYNCCDDIIVKNEDEDSETNPYKYQQNNIWIYLNIIAEVAIQRLKYLKMGNNTFTNFDYDYELNKIKTILNNKFNAPINNFTVMSKSSKNDGDKIDEENLLNSYSNLINIDVYIQFISFVIQCNYYKEKWSILANLIENFNLCTNELFSQFTLSFLIEAQKHIYEKAHLNTQNKQNELNHRVELYENWKNSRKKNKRQQLITGEIPQEQIDFERDYNILSKQLHIFKSISDIYRNDKEKSEELYNNFLNDANNALKAVDLCRKKIEEYQIEIISMKKYKYNFNINYKEYNSRVKAINNLQNNILNYFVNCIKVLKKRQENYLLIQILYEMSLILYSMDDEKKKSKAEVYFSEAIDTVFQKLYSIKAYREIKFEDYINKKGEKNIYVIPSFCYAVKILHKMAKYCYDNQLYIQRESALFASKITFYILNNIVPNPMIYAKYGTFRLNEINSNVDIFNNKFNIKSGDLLISLIELSEILIGYNNYENCLPMLCLAEYLSCDICRNVNYTLYSRILKIICLAELGYINEAIMIYYKVIKKFDLPEIINTGYKEYFTGRYANLSHNEDKINYFNNLPPDDEKNVSSVNNFMKLSVDSELKNLLGCNNYFYLIYSKLVILFKIFNKDSYLMYPEKTNFVNQREEMFIRIEKECRENISLLSAYEDICFISNCMKFIKIYDINYSENLKVLNQKLSEITDSNRITMEEVRNFITLKYNKNDIELSKERYELIFNYRILLSRVYKCQGLYLNSSMILYKAIENFNKLSKSNSNKILNFDNSEDYQFDLKPSEINVTGMAGGASQAKGKNAKDAKKDTKPAATTAKKDNKKKDEKIEEPKIDPEIAIKELLNQISNIIYNNKRIIPNSIYWFKLHYLHLINLYKMNRLNDCIYIIKCMEKNSKKVDDNYYFIRCKEIETYIYIQQYEIKNSENCYNEILNRKENKYFIDDYELAIFYGNYAEYLYTEKNYDLAINFLKLARNLIWEKYLEFNYLIEPQTAFTEKVLNNLFIDKEMMNKLIDKENNSGNVQNKKDAKKDDNQNKSNLIDFYDTESATTNENYDKENYNSCKIENNKDAFENIYYKFTDLLCKLELKYVYFQIINNSINSIDIKLCSSILKDLEIIIKRQLFPHTMYLIIINYLKGIISKYKFNKSLKEFLQSEFINDFKLLKKNNIDVLTVNKEILFKFNHYYNEKIYKEWSPSLKESKKFFEEALTIAKTDFYIFENNFSILDILKELSDVSLLLAEYDINKNLKYVDYSQIVNKINSLINTQHFYDKENDDLPYLKEEYVGDELKDKINEFKNKKTSVDNKEYNNYIKDFIYYSDLTMKLFNIKKLLNENTYDLCNNTSLVDASKLPREIALQIFESDYLNKKKNKDFTQNVVIKGGIDPFDVYNIIKNFIKEIEYFNFNFLIDDNLDEKIKIVSKLHKFLKNNSANYQQKCYIEFNISTFNDELEKINFIKNNQINVNYVTISYDLINHLSGLNSTFDNKEKYFNFIYLLGNNSGNENTTGTSMQQQTSSNNAKDNKNKKKDDKKKDNNANNNNTNSMEVNNDEKCDNIEYGRVLLNEKFIQIINQKIFNLKIRCRNSMGENEEKKNRDFKYYQKEYYEIIYEFIKEMLSGVKQFAEMKGVKDNFSEDDIGEVSVQNLDIWYNLLNFNTYTCTHQKFNALFRKINSELVKK